MIRPTLENIAALQSVAGTQKKTTKADQLTKAEKKHEELVKQAQKWVSLTFYGQLMKEMRNDPFRSKLFDGGNGGAAFGQMYDEELAQRMGKGTANGLVKSIVDRIEGNKAASKAYDRQMRDAKQIQDGDKGAYMSRQISELEIVLRGLIAEHRRLLTQVENHEAAMKKLELQEMERWRSAQEGTRLNIWALESRRRALVNEIAASVRRPTMTLVQIAQTWPKPGAVLLPLRDELRQLMQHITDKTQMSGKLAGSLLGHLNTVVRLVTGVANTAGVYSRRGVAVVGRRIGAMEAVG